MIQKSLSEEAHKSILKKYGTGVFTDPRKVMESPPMIVPMTPAIDISIYGGAQEGSWITLTGMPKMGKSTLALKFAANCQKPEYGGRTIYYIDVEGRISKKNLDWAGFDFDKFHLIRSHKLPPTEEFPNGEPVIYYAEDYLGMGLDFLKNDHGCVLIIDSIPMLTPRSTGEKSDFGEAGRRAEVNSLLSKFCQEVAQILPVNKNFVVAITQMMGNPSGKGKTRTEKGGFAIAYQADTKLEATYMEKISKKEGEAPIGQRVHWEVHCCSLGPPFQKPEMIIRYGEGVDTISEIIGCAKEYGVVELSGAWFKHKDAAGVEQKFQGEEKFRIYLKENPDETDIIYGKLLSLFK